MWVASTVAQLKQQRQALAGNVVLVPTMGSLHEGHLRHIEIGRETAEHVIVSIFVNPTQFGPDEDFDRYPRALDSDLGKCEQAAVTGVFCPDQSQLYPSNQIASELTVPSLTDQLEAKSRPRHFGGVCRVVIKLLNLVQPNMVTFGYKDYQQFLVVRALVKDLCLPVEIQPIETVRDVDGLALSSRHCYLSDNGHERAVGLYKALQTARMQIEVNNETDPQRVESAMAQLLEAYQVDMDYAVVRHPQTLAPLDCIEPRLTGDVVALVAGRVDGLRLIDNLLLGEKGS